MKNSSLKFSSLLIMFCVTSLLFAQEMDAEGCKDHPFFNRLENYYIDGCKENYNEYEFMMGNDKTQILEGTLIDILYTYDGPFGPNLPSKLQVIRNYENAIAKMGGQKVYSRTTDDGGWTGATFHLQKDGSEYWLGIYDLINNPVDQFTFVLLTVQGMKQEITANEMFEKINSGLPITLYINFETGKSAIKSDSENIVEELYQMMNENPDLKILVEGHTDNVGNKSSNQSLSEKRAASLKTALVTKGISSSKIETVGFGQDQPLADNSTDEGRAKNRRIEIKKI
ncbi:OmpA family protein [Gelidibacter japonicus]|uniref:OmpA family protein n=1 Tax=Gelidibacter japonicus TaxID=1962232 RepID=UPI00201FDB3E|nr:OmpA family protein [Gelidibacter japonicus]MCL8008765.1 OmpA family protein [Gelidibacter japonicus]